jgi:hypothetical protein
MTAAEITLQQQWQHRCHCLGCSNNHCRTVTTPTTVARWPTFFFLVYTLSLPVAYWPVCQLPLGHSPLQSTVPPRLCQHPHRHHGHINALGPRCRRGTSALTTTTPTSAPLQRGCSNTIAIAASTTTAAVLSKPRGL